MDGLGALEKQIGYEFSDRSLLSRALTHSSYANEANQRGGSGRHAEGGAGRHAEGAARRHAESAAGLKGGAGAGGRGAAQGSAVLHNELLEFLGDAILGFVIAEELYARMPGEGEGRLSQKRASIICEASLASCAGGLGIDSLLLLGNNMIGEKNRRHSSVLSDAMEAIFAAVYLDGGFDAARGVILRCLGGTVRDALTHGIAADHKSRLQEHYFAFDKNVKIEYSVTSESGPAHMRRYASQVSVNGRVLGSGEGHTKKESEQNAAKEALGSI